MTQDTATRSPQNLLREAFQFFDKGNLPDALKIAQSLRKEHPNHPDVLHLLGLISLKGGAFGQAEQFIRLAISVLPDQPVYQVNLGNALMQQGKKAEARAVYDKAGALDPSFPGVYVNRGMLSASEGNAEEATADFAKLIELNPNQPEGYIRLARLYSETGQFQEAATTYKDGLKMRPDGPMLLFGLASALERLGDLDGTIEACGKALAVLPDHPGVLGVWARAKRRQGHLEEAKDRLERVAVGGLPAELRRVIHGELGQIYDRMNEPGDAYDHFIGQNAAATEILELAGIDKQTYMRQVQDLSAAFTRSWVDSWDPIEKSDLTAVPAPVFLVGFPRSGTTLLDQFLDAHSQIDVIEEQPILLPLRDRLQELGGYPEALKSLSVSQVNELRALYVEGLKQTGADLDAHTVVNKLPLNIIHAGLIARVFPEATFIFAARHPADAVLSCFMQDFQLNASMAHFLTLKDSAALYEAVLSLWQTFRSHLPLNVVEVRYEELIVDPKKALARVLAALGREWQVAQEDHFTHARSRGTIRTPSFAQVTEPLYGHAADRWRRYETQLEGILPRLAPFIRDLGYD
jgi:tetratricopeptide (TPR) repeat protein